MNKNPLKFYKQHLHHNNISKLLLFKTIHLLIILCMLWGLTYLTIFMIFMVLQDLKQNARSAENNTKTMTDANMIKMDGF
jgi:hypothetical protein